MTIVDRKPETSRATHPEKTSGPYHYAVIVDVYDDGETTPVNECDRFLEVAGRYKASCAGHGRAHTSSMCFFSKIPLDEKQLAAELGPDAKIIRIIDINALDGNGCFDVSNKDGIIYPLPWETDTDKDANH
jgi:hypothetical protein